MRGKASPAARVFESPYSTTILPAKDAGRASKRAPKAEVAPQEPLAEAPVYIPTHGQVAAPVAAPEPEPTYAPAPPPVYEPPVYEPPVYEAPAPVSTPPPPAFAAPVADYPAGYPSAPGFPPQPHYANAAQVADPVYQPAPYQPVAFAPPTNPPSGYQPNRFEPQGYAAPGYAAPGYAPPGYAPPGQAQPYQNFPPTGGRSTGTKVLIGLAIGVVGFVLLLILAAIAIPVFLNQRAKPANRNVLLPETLAGQQRIVSADFSSDISAQIAHLQQTVPRVTQVNSAYYGQGGQPVFAVSAGKLQHRATVADEKSFFGAPDGPHKISFAPVGSGPFGGWMQCGVGIEDGVSITTCASLDDAAVVVVAAPNTSPDQLAIVTRIVISGIEHKS